jgi:serine/threonine-protein kinase SRPK3
MPEFLLKPLLTPILLALDYLHSVAQVVHTDIQEGNIRLSVPDQSVFDQVVAEEWASLSPRKTTDGRATHTSASLELPDDPGPPIVTDFGDARVGAGPFIGEVLPDLYRAPEIVLAIPWDDKIDIWALGLMVRTLLLLVFFENTTKLTASRFGTCLRERHIQAPRSSHGNITRS